MADNGTADGVVEPQPDGEFTLHVNCGRLKVEMYFQTQQACENAWYAAIKAAEVVQKSA